ncbi:hypothetical protein NB697_002295 [Xanthomonas sacchari]|uniref:DUF3037 domain-containing protein n=1 Tax=Xanthomonas sacchari TaxID=56458 RepID=UPI0022576DC5|nr:DUF3037 domain-containing protein [Xanthomonas sacchari]MCW0379449.1 hypothetical protein [Xanthomonas sacchari]
MSRCAYSAIVLRYVHDLVSGEFVNVGLLLFCRERKFVRFAVLPRTKRVLQFFPGSEARTIKRALGAAQVSARGLSGLFGNISADVEADRALVEASYRIVPLDDSALQWSPVTVGLTSDPQETFERLFDRLVLRYEEDQPKAKRTDEQVWRSFSKVLEKRNVSSLIREHEVEAKLETIKFKHALKNGKWHLLEPVSFDLATPESVTDKAKKLLGEMTLLRDRQQDFRLYFLVGKPSSLEVMEAYDRALRILGEVPIESTVYLESEAEKFAADLSKVAQAH